MSMGLGRMSRNDHHLIKIKSLLSCRRSFHFINEREEEGFLVNRFCRETETRYFSLLSNRNWATLRDFHSPYFRRSNRISSICDGLVHLYCYNRDLLWKPSKNQIKLLPPSKVPRFPGSVCESRGFGFDHISEDYKVVRFLLYNFDNVKIELYSYKNDSWKELLEIPDKNKLSVFTAKAYVDGRYYWLCHSGGPDENILSFDFATERFSFVPLPPKIGKFQFLGPEFVTKLVEFSGSLAVLIYPYARTIKKSFELWVLGKNGRSWDMELQFDLDGVKDPFWFSKDGRFFLFQGIYNDGLVVYDFRIKEYKEVDILAEQVIPCMCTLSPVQPPWRIAS